MLVINRDLGKSVHIRIDGKTLVVTYVKKNGRDQITLGFTGPKDFKILRSELGEPSEPSETKGETDNDHG